MTVNRLTTVMPRSAAVPVLMLTALLTAVCTAASQTAPAGSPSHEAFGGIWVLNRDRADAPAAFNAPDRSDGRTGGRRGGSARGGFGGRGRGFGGGRGSEADLQRQQAIQAYARTALEASRQLTIVVHDESVSITDAEGRVLALQTNDKRTDERAQNGLVKLSRKSRWDAAALVSEIDIENGPTILRRYELSPGGTQLSITTTVEPARGGNPIALTRMYDRPVEPR